RAFAKVALKKLGLRALVDVIPLDASLVRGSHGLAPLPGEEPVVITDTPPDSMESLGLWVRKRLQA
ncbi:MAG: alkaline phosphatase family protein, partial [Planctomycetota bacterium]